MTLTQKINTINKSWNITINSSSYYILSYLAIYGLYQIATALTATIFSIPAVIYYNRMAFLLNPDAWTFDSVKVIFSAGLILSLIVGLVFLVVYLKTIEFNGIIRLFFLWGFIHGLNMFISSFMIGAIIYEGAGYVLAWLYLSETSKMLILFIGIALLLFTGTLMAKPMFFSANSYFSNLNHRESVSFRWSQFFRPYFLCSCLIFLIRYPLTLFEILILLSPGILLLPLVWMTSRNPHYYFEDDDPKTTVQIIPLLLSISLLLIYRLVLMTGIRIE